MGGLRRRALSVHAVCSIIALGRAVAGLTGRHEDAACVGGCEGEGGGGERAHAGGGGGE